MRNPMALVSFQARLNAYVAWLCYVLPKVEPSSHTWFRPDTLPAAHHRKLVTHLPLSICTEGIENTMASVGTLTSQVNGGHAPSRLKELTGGKPIKSKNQLRRLKMKQKKATASAETSTVRRSYHLHLSLPLASYTTFEIRFRAPTCFANEPFLIERGGR